MPIVPQQNTLRTTPQGVNPRLRATLSPGEAARGGEELAQQGRIIQATAQKGINAQLEIQREANQLRVDDVLNQLREEAIRLQNDPSDGYANLKGYDALNRPEGKPLSDEYSSRLRTRMGELSAGLANDDQRTMFEAQGNNVLSRFRESTMAYEGDQFREYSQSVRRGTIQNGVQEVALNYDNPAWVEDTVVRIRAAARDLARQQGLSATEAEAEVRKAESAAHMVVLETALQRDDPVYADEYLKKNAKFMEADHILKARNVLDEQLTAQLAIKTAALTMQENMVDIETPESDRAFNIIIGQESSGRQFAKDGVTPLENKNRNNTSDFGVAQVNENTAKEAAKLAGLEWDEEKYKTDADYNRKLGKAYFEKQLQNFDGNLAKAFAAYNAGPGATRKAIEKGGEDWVAHLPASTQKYVEKAMKSFGDGKGKNQRPSLLDMQNSVREKIPNNPKALKLALDEVEREYNTITKELKARDEAALSDALRSVIENGGSYADLPPLLRARINPTDVDKVLDFANKLAKGEEIETNPTLYTQLTTHPEVLGELSDDQFLALRTQMSDSDFKYFAKERQKILSGDVPEGQDPGGLNTAAVNRALDLRLEQMGLPTSVSEKTRGTNEVTQVAGIRRFINEAMLSEQASRGKKMNDAEVEQFIDKLFAERITAQGWFYDEQKPLLTATLSDLPRETTTALRAAFKKEGIEPTDQEMLDAYWRWQYRARAQDKGTY